VLRRMEIVDLPGFNSRGDAEAKRQWVREADIQIWCTVATQAWKASEQAMWQSLAPAKHCSFLVLTHRDLLSDKQLEDVAGRMTRETQRFFSHWTAVATPEAISARNPRGQIVKSDVWASTGVEDFMKKLVDLLQSVLTQRRDTALPIVTAPLAASAPIAENGAAVVLPLATASPEPTPLASGPQPLASALHPLAAFAQIRQRVPNAFRRETPAYEAAAMLAGAFGLYAKDVLKPWVTVNCRSPLEAKTLEGLIPKTDTEILGCLIAHPSDPTSFTPADILKQIEGELSDAFQAINQPAF
jgi:hypothetical protein